MPETPEYKILRSETHSSEDRRGSIDSTIAKLEKMVKLHMAEGWEPVGGICAEHSPEFHIYAYCQSMVRRGDSGEE
jgi:hypothetical protein